MCRSKRDVFESRNHRHERQPPLIGEEVRRPRDGIGFSGTSRMLNQIFPAGPVREHGRPQLARRVKLISYSVSISSALIDLGISPGCGGTTVG